MRAARGAWHWHCALNHSMRRPSFWLSLNLALIAWATACHQPNGTVLGKIPKAPSASVLAIRAGDTPALVSVSGVMVEKCPVAGCWLKVQDPTGTIMVDTKAAGFVVVNVPLESKVTVVGKITTVGDEAVLEASGLRY